MAHTRILAVNLPGLLSEVLSAIVAEHEGVKIVGDTDARDVLAVVRAQDANVVVIGIDEGLADTMLTLLMTELPTLRIVTIDREGRRATAYERGALLHEVDEVSPNALVEMLCGATN